MTNKFATLPRSSVRGRDEWSLPEPRFRPTSGWPTIRALRVNSLCKALAYSESGTISSLPAVQAKNKPSTEEKDMRSKPSIVFCHGLWADGSCFNKLIVPLQAEGYECIASQHGLNSTAEDV